MNRAIFGNAGAPISEIISRLTADVPGTGAGGSTNTSPRVVKDTELFFYANSKRIGNLDTIEEEIAGLAAQEWFPDRQDFRAIIKRSTGMVDPPANAEVDSIDAFFAKLLAPVQRFHFFAHIFHPGGLTDLKVALSSRFERGSYQVEGATRNGIPLRFFDHSSIVALDGLVASSSDPLAETVRRVRKLNDDSRNPESPGGAVTRELVLWLSVPQTSNFPMDEDLFRALANLLHMKVLAFAFPIVFHPILQAAPPDQFRGRISVGSGTIATDAHDLLDQANTFP